MQIKIDKTYKKVLLATWLGWLFDGLDSSLYPLVANQALGELIGKNNPDFSSIASQILALFLFGWAVGGYLFGYLGDKIGRAKSLSYSILIYAVFTGLSGISHSWQELAFFRFLSGLGIGGEWALGVSLLAESIHPDKRIISTGFLATGFPLGYCLAIIANLLISPFGWRWVFFFGVIPAILVFFIRREIKEPELWLKVKVKTKNPFEIFEKKYLFNLFIAFLLGATLTIGIWGSLFWFPIWIERELGGSKLDMTYATFIMMFIHAIGCYLAGFALKVYSRKIFLFFSFFLSFIFAFTMFYFFHSYSYLIIIFAGLLGFSYGFIPAAFAIYFPELFPTRIRSTAEGFCYSTVRIFTAFGALFSGFLVNSFGGNIGKAAAFMSLVFLIGAGVSLFAPETDKEKLPM